MKVGLVSLGCAKNLVDSEMVLGMLKRGGHLIVNQPAEADAIIINTCGFIDAAKKESIDNILEMTAYQKKTIVIGCLVERYLPELKVELPEVDLWVPIHEYSTLNTQIAGLFADEVEIPTLKPDERMYSTPKYTGYLRISEGCNNHCTFCAIPLIRGGFVSRPLDEVLAEAEKMADTGIKELVIISQDTTNYGRDLPGKITIVTLLEALVNQNRFYSIRLLYLYPQEVTNELITFIKDHPVIAPYFDLPLQHSSDKIRKLMHRKGNRAMLVEKIKAIRLALPEAVIRTTLIVGFPGETADDQNDLLAFIDQMEFDHLGTFTYSREEGTPAYDLPNQVAEDVKKAHYEQVMTHQRKIAYKKNKARIGSIMSGIVIGYDKHHDLYLLRSSWNAPDDIDGKITFTSERILTEGQVVSVKITHAYVYDLAGVLVPVA